jgi:hypothetical protein
MIPNKWERERVQQLPVSGFFSDDVRHFALAFSGLCRGRRPTFLAEHPMCVDGATDIPEILQQQDLTSEN